MEKSKHPTLDNYILIDTLGKGGYSTVKLAVDQLTGMKCAIKIFQKDKIFLDSEACRYFAPEVASMKKLKHPNLINLYDYKENGLLTKVNGKQSKVIYLVLELACGGELFDFVALSGRFSEPVARYYFRQLIEGLDYIHQQGYAHRDLKPENIFLDENYNLKIADFGFASQVGKNDGSNLFKTQLGTEGYMAPEIITKKEYSGEEVDLFACGIILFIMLSASPPFYKATENDPFYKLIVGNRSDLFWRAHSKTKPGGESFYSNELKMTIISLLQFNPAFRISIADLKSLPWYNMPIPSKEEVFKEFTERKQMITLKNLQKKMIAQKKVKENKGPYRSMPICYCIEIPKVQRRLEDFNEIICKNTEVFTSSDPEIIMKELESLFYKWGYKYQVAADTYKMIVDIEDIKLCIKILRVNVDTYCVHFRRLSGDCLSFCTHYEKILRELFCEEETALEQDAIKKEM